MLSAERWVGCDGTRLSAQHQEALLKRGLTAETIAAAGLWSASAEEVRELLKFNPTNSPGLAIPYHHPLSGEIRFVRVRPDKAPLLDGKLAKYLSPRGVGNLLYFPPPVRRDSRTLLNPST